MARSRYGGEENAYGVSVGKLEGRRLLGRRMRRWEYNFKMNLKEIISGVVDSIDLDQLHICHILLLLM
jgi:hypothetical protein